ncbi:MAG: amidohydrolase family protein [Myxococcota bacterium]|nr:amidohydrolase family protein [Myxococcota bacterium]
MGNLIVKNGLLIDGTGRPARPADVRIRDGLVAEVGPDLAPDGEELVDAGGAYVCPGFIDSHTHLDPSMFWDPGCDPMPQHGVTTALIGNCSLSLAPVKPENLEEVMDVFCYIEDMPIEDFRSGIPWNWETWREYRDSMNENGAALNMASLIGHSMLRIYVMGPDAWERAATDEEIEAMCAELAEALEAGCFGISTSFFDVDRAGRFVPTRFAEQKEFEALAATMGKAGHGLVEFIPNFTGETPLEEIKQMADATAPHDGVIAVWNGLLHTEMAPERSDELIAYSQGLRDEGADIWPIASPRTVDFNINWEQTMVFMMLPEGWNKIMLVRGEERAAMLRDPEWRKVAREEWDRVDKSLFPNTRIEHARFTSVTKPEYERWLAKSLKDLVEERGGHPSDVFADWILENDLEPGVVAAGVSNSDVEGVAKMLVDDRVIVSASDAGAHVQMMCAAGDTTLLLTRHVRERGDFTLEKAIYELTGAQSERLGFKDRGILAPGYAGDLTVFDLDELAWEQDTFVSDLPSGGARLRRPPGGYRLTAVAGVITQRDGVLTGENPGRVLDGGAERPV